MAWCGRWACAAIVLACSAHARAEPTKTDEARAAKLKKQGDALVHASKYREGLAKYDESFAIVANPAIFYNRGRALQALGDFPAALDALEQFAALAPAKLKARVPHLSEMIADVSTHVATLVVQCNLAGASVTVRDKAIGTTPIAPFRTTGGDARITITAPGYLEYAASRTLKEGASETLDVHMEQAPACDEQCAEKPHDAEDATRARRSTFRTIAWITGGAGVVSLGAGLLFLGLSVADKGSAEPHCPNKVCDATGRQSINEAWTFANASTVFVVLGAAALGTSAVSFLITPKSAPVQARLVVTPTSAGIRGSF